jgi:RNA polymerase sigma-70 factor, ECF subfamily
VLQTGRGTPEGSARPDPPALHAVSPAPPGSHLPDDVLVQRAIHGDPRAFERLLRRHQDRMYAVARRITARDADAQDAAQTAFVAAWQKLPTFHGQAAFGTWLYRIVTNHALNVVRSRAPRERDTALDADRTDVGVAGSLGSPQSAARTAAMVRDLRAALALLPEPVRLCWVAREIDGFSYHEIAAMSGVGVDTVRGRLARARTVVAREMADWR